MKKIAFAALVAAGTLAVAAPASAATYNFYEPSTGTGTFGNDEVSSDPFSDLFTFVVNTRSSLSSSITSSRSGANDIDFTTITLTGPGGFSANYVERLAGTFELRTYGPQTIEAGTYTLSVNGNSQGMAAYTGDFTLSAGPEPATWALMILGFGAVGGAMRRRQSVAAKIRFA
jgi:hypothetical protein